MEIKFQFQYNKQFHYILSKFLSLPIFHIIPHFLCKVIFCDNINSQIMITHLHSWREYLHIIDFTINLHQIILLYSTIHYIWIGFLLHYVCKFHFFLHSRLLYCKSCVLKFMGNFPRTVYKNRTQYTEVDIFTNKSIIMTFRGYLFSSN